MLASLLKTKKTRNRVQNKSKRETKLLLRLDWGSSDGCARVLLVNPAAGTDVGPVLRSKVLVLVVHSVIIH